ncbi:hypothetical protein [Cryobacterium arcticum]|uniref:Uncharacterized protein n=1 Tax=Cryobacterium arcticum TaxID=670052 RepID=A0A1B1BQE4_9MICO|nr:hypothetical protein [Cryobacterium arcticum]ANP74804.1 hypothetical protein PA27867_3890 [Cryobacterium arcticum]
MGSDTKHPDTPHVQRSVRADTLEQIEPSYAAEFVPRPFSLTPAELGGLPATLASEPTSVRAWVRYPAIARHVQALALAWTPRAVYVEWEDSGTHRVWVWAPAVERAAPAPPTAPPRPSVDMLSVRSAEPLVELVKARLARSGAEFVTSTERPAGPFGVVVFGSIDQHHVRLELSADPTTNTCVVQLFDLTAKKVLVERVAAPTFQEAIEAYAWAEAIDALTLSGEPDHELP